MKRQPGRKEDSESQAYRPQSKQEPANTDKGEQELASLLSIDKRQEALLIAEKRQAVVEGQPAIAQSPSELKASHQPRAFHSSSTSLESATSTSDVARRLQRSSERPAPVSSSPCAKYAEQLIAKATGKLALPTMAQVDEDQSADANPQQPLSAFAIFPSQARQVGPAGAGGDGRGEERERTSSAVARGTQLERPAPASSSASTSSPCAKMADQLVARAMGKVPWPTGCRVKIDTPPHLTAPARAQAYAQVHAAYPGRKVPLPANHPSLRNVLEVSGPACRRHAPALRRTCTHVHACARAHAHTKIHTDTHIRIHANTSRRTHIPTHARTSTQAWCRMTAHSLWPEFAGMDLFYGPID